MSYNNDKDKDKIDSILLPFLSLGIPIWAMPIVLIGIVILCFMSSVACVSTMTALTHFLFGSDFLNSSFEKFLQGCLIVVIFYICCHMLCYYAITIGEIAQRKKKESKQTND